MKHLGLIFVLVFFSMNAFATSGMPKKIKVQLSIDRIVEASIDEIDWKRFTQKKCEARDGTYYGSTGKYLYEMPYSSTRKPKLSVGDAVYEVSTVRIYFHVGNTNCELNSIADISYISINYENKYDTRISLDLKNESAKSDWERVSINDDKIRYWGGEILETY